MIEYIQGKKNIVAYQLEQLTNDANTNTTQKSNYLTETMSEIYVINEILEGKSPINCNIMDLQEQN